MDINEVLSCAFLLLSQTFDDSCVLCGSSRCSFPSATASSELISSCPFVHLVAVLLLVCCLFFFFCLADIVGASQAPLAALENSRPHALMVAPTNYDSLRPHAAERPPSPRGMFGMQRSAPNGIRAAQFRSCVCRCNFEALFP